VPACGISLGLERILVVMGERAMFPASLATKSADVMVTQWNAGRGADTLKLAAQLRSAGLRVDVYPEAEKIGKQFKYASSRGVRFVLVVGDDEEARGEVAVKDLLSGEQAAVPRADVAAYICARTPAGAEPTASHG
jgi:histidyl-tRNA synthetase